MLLSSTGRTGPGDDSMIHEILFDESGPVAYHSAVHDGFGYLKRHHNIGPGYKYLGAFSVFSADNPLSEQISGLEFWGKLLTGDIKKKFPEKIY